MTIIHKIYTACNKRRRKWGVWEALAYPDRPKSVIRVKVLGNFNFFSSSHVKHQLQCIFLSLVRSQNFGQFKFLGSFATF